MHFRVEMLVILWRTAGKPSSMWWRAPTNRSQSDHIVLCSASIPRAYNLILIQRCPLVISTEAGFSGNQGEAELPPIDEAGGYELRYLKYSRQLDTFTVQVVHPFTVYPSSNNAECLPLDYSLSTPRQEYCLGEPISLLWRVPSYFPQDVSGLSLLHP
jgi:hypothetical protein